MPDTISWYIWCFVFEWNFKVFAVIELFYVISFPYCYGAIDIDLIFIFINRDAHTLIYLVQIHFLCFATMFRDRRNADRWLTALFSSMWNRKTLERDFDLGNFDHTVWFVLVAKQTKTITYELNKKKGCLRISVSGCRSGCCSSSCSGCCGSGLRTIMISIAYNTPFAIIDESKSLSRDQRTNSPSRTVSVRGSSPGWHSSQPS